MKEIIKWGAISLVVYLFMFWLIPVNIYSSMLYLIAIAGAAGLTFTLSKLLAAIFLGKYMAAAKNTDLSADERKAEMAKATQPDGCMIGFTIVALFFLIGGLTIWHEVEMESDELINYGQITTANVINGSSVSGRQFDFSNLVLGFKTIKGDSVFLRHSISASVFSRFFKHQSIPIVYSTRYPEILEIIYNDQQLEKYQKKDKIKSD